MKRPAYLTLFFNALIFSVFSQNVAINGTGALPNTSAMLDVSSTNSGFLVPRMTTAQKTAIATPATGLLIYQTTAPVGFWYYDGTTWLPFLSSSTGWSILGNAGTSVTTNFLGTTDNNDLAFRVNNIRSGLIEQNPATANTNFGFSSLLNNTSFGNTAFGHNAMLSSSNGFGNCAVGASAMQSNQSGYYNSVMGYQAMFNNTIGKYNAVLGYGALYSNTTGDMNIAVGSYAMYLNSGGYGNVAIGEEAAYSNTVGQFNVAIGRSAFRTNTIGNFNVATGLNALYSNLSGDGNIASGYYALYSNTTGDDNIASGVNTLQQNTTGLSNVAIGVLGLNLNTTGSSNSSLGGYALRSNTTGNLNSALGYSANVSAGAFTNATAIGANSIVNASNKVRVGDVNVTSIGGQVGWTTFSDARYKTNIQSNVPGLAFISKLTPVTYNVDAEGINRLYGGSENYKNPNANTMIHSGFLAQDVEKAAKSLGYDFSGIDVPANDKALYGLRYADFVVPMVKAIQEQQEMIVELKKEIEELKSQRKQ